MNGSALRLRQRLGLSGPGIEGEERGEAERVPGLANPPVRVAPDPEVSSVSGRRRFSAEYRARIVREADACAEIGEVGSLLRREGLYSPSLSNWRKEYGKAGEAALRDDKRGRKGMKIALKKKLLTASEPRGILGICAGDELCKRDRWSRGQLWERTP